MVYDSLCASLCNYVFLLQYTSVCMLVCMCLYVHKSMRTFHVVV